MHVLSTSVSVHSLLSDGVNVSCHFLTASYEDEVETMKNYGGL